MVRCNNERLGDAPQGIANLRETTMTDFRLVAEQDSSAADGVVRRLSSADLAAFRDHLLRLDPQARRSRFSGAVADSFLEAYAERALTPDRFAFGFFVDGVVRGVAELSRHEPPYDHEGEAAFSVETPFRRSGVGTALFRRVLLAARNRGIATLYVACLPYNEAMQALARKNGARLVYDSFETLGRITSAPPTPFSVFREVVGFGFEVMIAALSADRYGRAPLKTASRP